MQAAELVLRDIHRPPAPPWWPPAPGWWLLAALAVATVALLAWWRARHRRRRRAIEALFDDTVAAAATPAAEIAAISELLRRAARRRDPQADRLHGDAWLAFLDQPARVRKRGKPDGEPARAFGEGPGRLLLEGAYRRDADPLAVAELRTLARARFLAWMASRPPRRSVRR